MCVTFCRVGATESPDVTSRALSANHRGANSCSKSTLTIPTDRVFMNGAKKSCFNRTDSNTHSLEPVPVSIRELKASWFSANSWTCRSIKGPSDTPTSGSVELCHRLRCGHTLCVGLTKYDWLRQPVGALHRTVTHVLSQATLGAGLKA